MKHGIENHTFEILEECDVNLLNERERFYQDEYDVLGENGLNLKLTETEDRNGFYSQELRDKLSESQKKYNLSLTEEEKLERNRKVSESTKGLVKTPEHLKKIRDKLVGRTDLKYGGWFHSEESKANISKNKKKKVINIESGEIFDSVDEACLTVNLNPDQLRYRLTEEIKNETGLEYLEPDRYKRKKK